MVFFFFKQKSAYEMRISDWSSDVCSSDLVGQCGDTTTIADRSASVRPSWRRFGPSSPGSIENIGEPWETKRDGARDMEGSCKGRGRRNVRGGCCQMTVGAWAGTVWRRARSASMLRLPAPFAARTRKPPAMATFFQKLTACAGSPKSAWKSAAEMIENTAIASATQRV